MGESSSVIFYLVWYKTGIKAGGTADSTDHVPEGYFTLHLACEPMWVIKPQSQNALMCHITLHSAQQTTKQPKEKQRSWECCLQIDYSFPPSVALSRFFSSTLYSFSILLHVSSNKRQRDYPSACKSPTEPSVSTGPPTNQQPPRATVDKKTVFQLWFVSY